MILSAMGSIAAPSLVNCFKARAAIPSSQSVTISPMKTASAMPGRCCRYKKMNTGTARSRKQVREFGRFTGLLGVAGFVPFREGIFRVRPKLHRLARSAVGRDQHLHLRAYDLLPLVARHFFRTGYFMPSLVRRGFRIGLRHRDRTVIDADKDALVAAGIDAKG